MDLPFCPLCGSVRLAEEGGFFNEEVYRRLRCRDCKWAQPIPSEPVTGTSGDDDPLVIRSRSA